MRLRPSLVAQLLLLSVVIVKAAPADASPLFFNLMRMTMTFIALHC